jgi:hypothetical protein
MTGGVVGSAGTADVDATGPGTGATGGGAVAVVAGGDAVTAVVGGCGADADAVSGTVAAGGAAVAVCVERIAKNVSPTAATTRTSPPTAIIGRADRFFSP